MPLGEFFGGVGGCFGSIGYQTPRNKLFLPCHDRYPSFDCIASSKSDLFPVMVGLCLGYPLSILFINFKDKKFLGAVEVLRFDGLGTASLLFVDNVVCWGKVAEYTLRVLMASSSRAVCNQMLPQMEELKYCGIFTTEGRMEHEMQ